MADNFEREILNTAKTQKEVKLKSANENTNNRPLVLVGSSGSGKSTLVQHLIEHFPDQFCYSISSTTRAPQEGEIDGVHYNFVLSKDAFLADADAGLFLEYQYINGEYYGTPLHSIENASDQLKICLLAIDINGAL